MAELSDNCIFCNILKGAIPSKKVYDDEHCSAILDINPAGIGHVLLIPKDHVAIFPQLPQETVEHLAFIAKGLSKSMLKNLGCQGTTLFIANGAVAGQKADHTMIHLIPRFEKDNVGIVLPSHKLPDNVKQQLVDGLSPLVAQILGGKMPEKKEEKVEGKEAEKKKEEIGENKEMPGKKQDNPKSSLDSITELLTRG